MSPGRPNRSAGACGEVVRALPSPDRLHGGRCRAFTWLCPPGIHRRRYGEIRPGFYMISPSGRSGYRAGAHTPGHDPPPLSCVLGKRRPGMHTSSAMCLLYPGKSAPGGHPWVYPKSS